MLDRKTRSQPRSAASNVIHFKKNGEIVVEPVKMAKERKRLLKERLMLFYSGSSRSASAIAKTFVDTLVDRAAQLRRIARHGF